MSKKSTGVEELTKVIMYLRSRVFPKLSDRELLNFMLALKSWSLDILGESEEKASTIDSPPPVKGDMDPESWGDDFPERREMGG